MPNMKYFEIFESVRSCIWVSRWIYLPFVFGIFFSRFLQKKLKFWKISIWIQSYHFFPNKLIKWKQMVMNDALWGFSLILGLYIGKPSVVDRLFLNVFQPQKCLIFFWYFVPIFLNFSHFTTVKTLVKLYFSES